MKLSYILNLRDFAIVFLIGFILGIFYGILSAIICSQKSVIIKNILDFLFTILSLTIFLTLILYINLGEFRLFLLVGYVLGIILERRTLGKIFAKGYNWVYNKLIAGARKFTKSKVGRFIFKWKTRLKWLKSSQ